jgi:protein-disulfide isomerase
MGPALSAALALALTLTSAATALCQTPPSAPPAAGKSQPPAAPAAGPAEKALEAYLGKFLPWDPDMKLTVARTNEKSVPGFKAYKTHRTGRYSKLDGDKVVLVSDDGHWFFAGDTLPSKDPRPVKSSEDLAWLSNYLTGLFRAQAVATLAPERDKGGMKAVAIAIETGYTRVRLPGFITPDGRVFLQGYLFDYTEDPRAERRRMIDLSANRADGPADAKVTVVEYADMECGYCKFRGLQMDKLLEANTGIVSVRRHYKFFPLWIAHVWAMKAASAADCIFHFAGAQPMFHFKQTVYAAQESMTVGGIDQLAITTAQGEGVSTADFLSCYLRDESFARIVRDLEEGYKLGVNSTPTYFIDGTEITWIEDKVMEDYLRTLFPKIKTIDYGPRK